MPVRAHAPHRQVGGDRLGQRRHPARPGLHPPLPLPLPLPLPPTPCSTRSTLALALVPSPTPCSTTRPPRTLPLPLPLTPTPTPCSSRWAPRWRAPSSRASRHHHATITPRAGRRHDAALLARASRHHHPTITPPSRHHHVMRAAGVPRARGPVWEEGGRGSGAGTGQKRRSRCRAPSLHPVALTCGLDLWP